MHGCVAFRAPDQIFLHAGAVAYLGRMIVLPAAALTGKSTLVAALVRAGATYYSDQFAVVDEQGRVHPYATPLRDPESRFHRGAYEWQSKPARRGRASPGGRIVLTELPPRG